MRIIILSTHAHIGRFARSLSPVRHRRVTVAVRRSALWIRSAEVDYGRLGRRRLGSLLTEDLVHDLGASSKGRHDLMPVDQLGRGCLVVSGEQRDRFDRHAMSGQQRYERMP